jgi:7-cyano-7-deazaguanine reductase
LLPLAWNLDTQGGEFKAELPSLTEIRPPAKGWGMSKKLTQLGHTVPWPRSPEEARLEAVPNKHPDSDYLARFTAPEFTCLCAVTGQPDFAHLVIDYVPAKALVESKSLKLFLGSFRNHQGFHEDCTLIVGKRIVAAIKPKFLRIAGYWYPRGGIPIDVFWQTGKLPASVWLPDTGVAPYRGRG